jgi:hypothetical protein
VNNFNSSFLDDSNGNLESTGAWKARILRVQSCDKLGVICINPRPDFRYISITLEYCYCGRGKVTFNPGVIALVCFGSSPLQGLARLPLFYSDENSQQINKLSEFPVTFEIEAGRIYYATLVYEFHQNCFEFRLYFPGQEGLTIELSSGGLIYLF